MDTSLFVQKTAVERGWKVQGNECFLDTVITGLDQNFEAYGYRLCPCRDGTGNKNQDKDIICPCDYAAEDIAEYGHCYCGLFLSGQMAASGEEVNSIPERRPENQFP